MKQVEKFDLYIKGSLSQEELNRFTKEMVKENFVDEDLKTKWHAVLKKDLGLQELKSIRGVERPGPAPEVKKIFKLRFFLQVAAALLVLVAAGLFIFNSISGQNIQQLAGLELEVPYSISDSRTGIEVEETRLLANDYYRLKDYTEAIPLYLQLVNATDGMNTKDAFYLGMSYLYADDFASAINYLRPITESNATGLQTEASWFLSIAYIKDNQLENAKVGLQQIAAKKGWKSKEAEQLLAAMD